MTEIPTPYRTPVLEQLAASPDWDLHVCYLASRQRNRLWAECPKGALSGRTTVLPGLQIGSFGAHSMFLNVGVDAYLRKIRPDLILVSGYAQLSFWRARAYALGHQISYVTVTESHLKKQRPCWIHRLKQPFVHRYFSKAAGHLTTGSAAKEYVARYGGSPEATFLFPNTIDVEAYQARCDLFRKKRDRHRSDLGMSEGPAILYVGHLAEWKGVRLLLHAFLSLLSRIPDATLHFVGHGPEEVRLRAEMGAAGDHVFFHGHQDREALPRYYACADLFVLPSRHETWGVVLLEAMAAGLPVVCSDAVGAADDFVRDGETGFLFAAGDERACTARMEDVLGDRSLAGKMGARGLATAHEWSTHRALAGFRTVVEHCRTTSSIQERHQ